MTDEFEKFWAVYPKKRSKGDARKAWMQTASVRPGVEKIVRAVMVMCGSDDWKRDGGQYIPYPGTWLRAEGWEDAPDVELVNGKVWWETVSGVEKKAAEVGFPAFDPSQERFPAYTGRLRGFIDGQKVVSIR